MAPVEHTLPLRILHLEDSLADHRLTARALRDSGMQVALCHVDTLADFAAALADNAFDALLADYQLTGFTALDAWQLVADAPRAPPFILLSGAIGEAAAVDAIRLGMADYVLKDQLFRLPHVISRACEVHHARRQRALAAEELARSQANLAQLTEHLQESIEAERAAIAREIHDDIGGALTAIRFDLAWLARHSQDDGQRTHAASATEMLQHAIDASQRLMMNLRPPVLDQGLVAAVRWLAESFERRTRVPVRVSASREAMDMPPALQLVAYRTAQEALTNVHKHAQARRVHIDLSDHEGVLTLEVSDDGRGIAPEMLQKPRSFGLRGLQERARRAGGWLDISSRPGQGTSVIMSVPLTSDGCDAGGEP